MNTQIKEIIKNINLLQDLNNDLIINSNDDLDTLIEFISFNSEIQSNLKTLTELCKSEIKQYYMGNFNYTLPQINHQIKIEKSINPKFTTNKNYNFGFRYIALETNEENYLMTISFQEAINTFKHSKYHIQIVNFRCKDDRNRYDILIKTFNLLSKISYNKVILK